MNIYCPSCENECSEAAIACPKCGHPLAASAIPISGTLTTCPNCEAACSAVAVTCLKCGQRLAACPNCEAPCSETGVTCTRCGHPLTAPDILVPGLITEPVPMNICCPSCQAANDADAVACGLCGHQLVRSIRKSPHPAPRAMNPLEWTVGGLFVLCIFICCSGISLLLDDSSPSVDRPKHEATRNGGTERPIEHNLAAIHAEGVPDRRTVGEFRRVVDRIAINCPENTRQEIGDVSTGAWLILQEQGTRIGLLSWMRELDVATRDGFCQGNLAEFAAAVMVLEKSLEKP